MKIDVVKPRCPFCHEEIEPRGRKRGCEICMAWHHAACWSEHGRCAACDGSEAGTQPPNREDSPASRGKTGDLPKVIVDLPPPSQFWAVVFNPKIYRIDDALCELEVDLWTFARGQVAPGDGVLFWQSRDAKGRRGVRAAGLVCSVAADCAEPHELRRFWTQPDNGIRRRAWVRYLPRDGFPIWLGPTGNEVVAHLSVARASGGGVYRVTETEWQNVMRRANQVASGTALVPVRDSVIWIPHVNGDALRVRLESLRPGMVIRLRVNGVEGEWERMCDGTDGRPTLGMRPLGEAKDLWQRLVAGSVGVTVEVSLLTDPKA